MRTDYFYESKGKGKIHYCRWTPDGSPKAVFQIIHGIAEHIERYDDFANYLTRHGYLVVAEDHMGHGQSGGDGTIPGYFHGGWDAAVEDSYQLLLDIRQEYPDIPYILFGHSMGSFLARSILAKHPDSGITAAIISGTCWQPPAAMPAIVKVMETACKLLDETKPNDKLQNFVFGSYNARVEHPQSPLDWVSRDRKVVAAHPMNHGFRPTAGLLRDMMKGIHFIEQKENLSNMRKDLPIFFIAGGDDPVGSYGKGVHACAQAFQKAGMQDVTIKIYPLHRHEILNELNKENVYKDIIKWLNEKISVKIVNCQL